MNIPRAPLISLLAVSIAVSSQEATPTAKDNFPTCTLLFTTVTKFHAANARLASRVQVEKSLGKPFQKRASAEGDVLVYVGGNCMALLAFNTAAVYQRVDLQMRSADISPAPQRGATAINSAPATSSDAPAPSVGRSAPHSQQTNTGPRGGCYVYTASGKKRYVDRSNCN